MCEKFLLVLHCAIFSGIIIIRFVLLEKGSILLDARCATSPQAAAKVFPV